MSSTASPATNPAVRAEPGGHERGDHRPLSRPGQGPRRARPVHDEGRSRLAQLHQDPQGRRARWRPSPGSSRPVTVAHCGPVLEAGSSPGPLSTTRCAHGVDLHPLDPRASPTRRIISALDAAVDAIPPPRAGHGLRQRVGIHQPRRGAVGREPGHLLHPLAPVQEERPGHHRDPRSNHVVRRYASPLPPRTPTPSVRCRAACGSWSTSESTS